MGTGLWVLILIVRKCDSGLRQGKKPRLMFPVVSVDFLYLSSFRPVTHLTPHSCNDDHANFIFLTPPLLTDVVETGTGSDLPHRDFLQIDLWLQLYYAESSHWIKTKRYPSLMAIVPISGTGGGVPCM